MTATDSQNTFRSRIRSLLDRWQRGGLPSRSGFIDTARSLKRWREENRTDGLWPHPPLMITATLDDGLGQGLEPIHLLSEAIGVRILFLGLLQPADRIIAEAGKRRPDLIGLTVLQLDSEAALARIGNGRPPGTTLLAGGPSFRFDRDLARRAGVDFVAASAADFLEFMLGFDPRRVETAAEGL
jgi:hypothetical protein